MFSAMVPANSLGSCPTYLRWGRSVGLASASARLAAVPLARRFPNASERSTQRRAAVQNVEGAMILSSGIGRVRIPYRPIRKTHPIWWRSQRTLSAVSGVPSSLTTPAEGS